MKQTGRFYAEKMSGVFLVKSPKNAVTEQFLRWHGALKPYGDDLLPPLVTNPRMANAGTDAGSHAEVPLAASGS